MSFVKSVMHMNAYVKDLIAFLTLSVQILSAENKLLKHSQNDLIGTNIQLSEVAC